MTILGRYVFRQVATAFLVSLFTLTAVVWLTQVLRQLDVVTIQGQSVWIFLSITLLALPAFVSVIAPIALFLAAIYTLNRMNNDSELVVVSAAGASRSRIIAPYLALSVIVALLVGTMNLYLMPRSLSVLREVITSVRESVFSQIIQPGRFSSPDTNFTIHIRERSSTGELKGLLLRDARDPQMELVYLADSGRLINGSDGTYLLLQNGTLQRNEGAPDKIQMVVYDRYVVDLSQLKPPSSANIDYKPRERDTLYLLNPSPDDVYFQQAPGRFRAELHERLSSVLYPFALAAIGVACVGFARTTRDGRGFGIAVAVVFALVVRIAGFAINNLAAKSAAAVPLTYALPLSTIVIFGAIAFGLSRLRRVESIYEFAHDVIARLRNRFGGLTPEGAG